MKKLELPKDLSLPFIAYGSFKPGELRYNIIKDYVDYSNKITISGLMKEKDGIPFFQSAETNSYYNFTYDAFEIYFKKDKEKKAYELICDNEPSSFYEWKLYGGYNILATRPKIKGLTNFLDKNWTFKDDPYFTEGLKVCNDFLKRKINPGDNEYTVFFTLSAGYMLLWTIIERFCGMKYGNLSPNQKIMSLPNDDEIDWTFLAKYNFREDIIFRSDRDRDRLVNRNDSSIVQRFKYYYGMRSNVVHRGKEAIMDSERLSSAFRELTYIFEGILIHNYGFTFNRIINIKRENFYSKD